MAIASTSLNHLDYFWVTNLIGSGSGIGTETGQDDVIKWKHFTGPLCGEFTDHRWIPLTKANTPSWKVRIKRVVFSKLNLF